MVYTTYLWWFGVCFIIVLPTLYHVLWAGDYIPIYPLFWFGLDFASPSKLTKRHPPVISVESKNNYPSMQGGSTPLHVDL